MTRVQQPDPIGLVEERLEVGKYPVERGRVVLRTRVEERSEIAEALLRQDEVSVERVAIGRPIETMPPVREEDGVLVVPVVEEELVVTKRLILKEEIRIVRRTRIETVRETVPLRFERVEIERQARDTPNTDPQKGAPSMTDRTITAMYDTRGAAESARDELIGLSVNPTDVSVRNAADSTDTASETPETGGFWASLKELFMPDEDRQTYTEGLNRGGYLLTVRISDELVDEADEIVEVLERYEPIDLDQRSEQWRREGWTSAEPGVLPADSAAALGTAPATASLAYDTAAPPARADLAVTGEDEIVQAAEEELQVGKREVGRGKLRVRSYVTERPVEEQVELRQEHVTIERRPVDRAVAPGEATFQERTIEAVERGEEVVISKSARVTEEVALRKDVEHETRTVHDTVRKQEIEVEDDRGLTQPAGTDTVHETNVVPPERPDR